MIRYMFNAAILRHELRWYACRQELSIKYGETFGEDDPVGRPHQFVCPRGKERNYRTNSTTQSIIVHTVPRDHRTTIVVGGKLDRSLAARN